MLDNRLISDFPCQSFDRGLYAPYALGKLAQLIALQHLAVMQGHSHALNTGFGQITLHRRVVFQVTLFRVTLFDAIQRRLRDIDIAAFDQFRHLTEEKGQKQSPDMTAIHIGVGHDDDFMVTRLVGIEFIAPDTRTDRGNQSPDFRRGQHFVKPRAFDVQDFTAQRQNRLILARTSLFG